MASRTFKLKDVCSVLSGFAFKSNFFSDVGMPLIRIRDVVRGFSETCYAGDYDKKYVVQNGEMLIGMDGDFNLEYWDGGPALLNQRVCKITPDESVLNKVFLYYFLPLKLKEIWEATPYVTVKHLSSKDVEEIEIPAWPLATQKHIAHVLEQADQLRKQAQQMESELNQLAQSLFLEMFGDPVTNPKEFRVVNIQEVVDIRDGTHDTPSYVENGIPFVTSTHLCGDYIDFSKAPKITEADHRFFSKRSLVEDGDILFGMIGTVGNATLVKKDFEFSIKNVALFKPLRDKVSSYYLWMYLRNEKFLHQLFSTSGKGGNQKFVALGPLRGIELMLPPQELMAEFATRLSAILERRQIAEGQALMINDMFNSLMQRAFNGELTTPERKAA